MSLSDKLTPDLKTAMLAKDEAALRGLRAIKAALILLRTEKGVEPTEEEELKMLQKLVKQRKESLEIYKTQGREDLAKTEQEEVTVIEKYLPSQLSEDEIRTQLKQIIEQTGAKTAAETGKVMGAASKHFAGKADNKTVAALVKELLA